MNTDNKVLLLGGTIVDRNFEVEHYPESGQDTSILHSFDKIGGCALNVAVTLNNLGSIPYIVAKLGDDEAGMKIKQYVKSLALPTTCISMEPGKQTGYCLTIIDKTGERTFFTYKGCETEFSPSMLPADLPNIITFAYITGYYLLNRQTASAALELIEQLRQKACQILFDPGPLVGDMDTSQLLKMISLSDWMIPNSAELEIIKKTLGFKAEPVEWLKSQGCQHIVVKKGEQGVDVYSASTMLSVKSFQVKPIDTTGAGDSFTGGLIHALAKGLALNQAVELASACGAFTATIKGPHGIFSLNEINYFIATHKDKN